MHDVLGFWEKFKAGYKKRSHSPSGELKVPNMIESHIQGFGRVYDENLKKYLCVASHNNKGYSKGFMMYLNCGKSGNVIKQDVPLEHYNHQGGLQVVGNYMFIAVENSGYNSSFVRLCDLSNLFSSSKPAWIDIEKFMISMPDHGVGMVGAARYTDAAGMRICGDNTMEFYATQRNFVGGNMKYDILSL